MEGATATFAMFVPEPLAPADLGIAQAYYEVCAQRMMEELSDEDKLEMYFISRVAYFFVGVFIEGNHKNKYTNYGKQIYYNTSKLTNAPMNTQYFNQLPMRQVAHAVQVSKKLSWPPYLELLTCNVWYLDFVYLMLQWKCLALIIIWCYAYA